MARLNISIPDDLKSRMDSHPSVNWSQTAAEAFTLAINNFELSIEVKNMTDAIARLKASKAKHTNDTQKQGYEFGLKWAMEDSSYEELLRLAEINDRPHTYPENLCELAELITQRDYDFDDLLEAGVDDPAYIKGFIEGALEVFSKVD